MLKKTTCLALISFSLLSFSQHHNKIDSLKKIWSDRSQPDSVLCDILTKITGSYIFNKPDTARILCKTLEDFSHKKGLLKWETAAVINEGSSYFVEGRYLESLASFEKAMALAKLGKNERQQAVAKCNMGNVYKEQGNYSRALDYYLKALRIHEKIKYAKGIAIVNGNIGGVYYLLEDNDRSLQYYLVAEKMYKDLNESQALAVSKGNIGNIYFMKEDYTKAMEYYVSANLLCEETGDLGSRARNLGNMALIFNKTGKFEEAIRTSEEAIKIDKEMEDEAGLSTRYKLLGEIYKEQNNTKAAETNFLRSLDLSYKNNILENITECEKFLAEICFKTDRYKEAYLHHNKFVTAKDSLSNVEKKNEILSLEMNYSFDKKLAADSIKNASKAEQEEFKHQHAIKVQKTYTYGGAIGFVMMLVVAGVSFRAFKNKQKANIVITKQKEEVELSKKIIEEQKHIVEEKQKEIIDSITYAQRIQRALITNEKYIEKSLNKLIKG